MLTTVNLAKSEPNNLRKRCCCNCGKCIRIKDPSNNHLVLRNECALDHHFISYQNTFQGWCRHWCKDHTFDNCHPDTDTF